jgi:integrase
VLQQLQHDDATKPIAISRQVAIVFLLALETGMRAGEVCGLTWDRVFLVQKKVYLHITKNGRPREVPLSKRAIELLQQMQQVNDTKVFAVEVPTLDAYFRKAKKQAGVKGLLFTIRVIQQRHASLKS